MRTQKPFEKITQKSSKKTVKACLEFWEWLKDNNCDPVNILIQHCGKRSWEVMFIVSNAKWHSLEDGISDKAYEKSYEIFDVINVNFVRYHCSVMICDIESKFNYTLAYCDGYKYSYLPVKGDATI